MEYYELKKDELIDLIDTFLLDKLNNEVYIVKKVPATSLLTVNRLDIGFKLYYLRNERKNCVISRQIYSEDIRAQTLGTYKEYGNESKDSLVEYISTFDELNSVMKTGQFDPSTSLIPLANDGSILNGAHRVSSGIYNRKFVYVLETELNPYNIDQKYFRDRTVSESFIRRAVLEFVKYSPDTYVGFLWQSGENQWDTSFKKFRNVLYTADYELSELGAYNLLIELYKHMDWVGSPKDDFKGIDPKVMECFPSGYKVRMVVFKGESLEAVQGIKSEIREICQIGYSSVHITDNQEEAQRILELMLNENGFHFLNYARPYRFPGLVEKVSQNLGLVGNDDIIVTGSTVLGIYGLRRPSDLDVLCASEIEYKRYNLDAHDSQIDFYEKSKHELVFSDENYFEYLGVKFLSVLELYSFLSNRGESKDLIALKQLSPILIGKPSFKISLKTKLGYYRIKIVRKINSALFDLLKFTGTYYPIRTVYRKIKK